MKAYKNYKSKQQYKEYNFEFDKKIKLIDNINLIYKAKYNIKIFGAELNSMITFYYDGMPLSNIEILSIYDFEKIDLHIKTLSKIEDYIAKNKSKLFDLDMNCYNVHFPTNMKMIEKLIEQTI